MSTRFEPILVLQRPAPGLPGDRPFDVPDLDAPPPAPPDITALATAEAAATAAAQAALLAAARAAGFTEGEAAGRAAAAASQAAGTAAALDAIAGTLGDAGAAAATAAVQAAGDLAGLLLAALDAALPAAAARLAAYSAALLADRLRPLIEDSVAVTLHVAPGCGPEAEARIADPRLRVLEDPMLPAGAARAAWRGGGAAFSPAAQRQAVAALLESFGLQPSAEEQ